MEGFRPPHITLACRACAVVMLLGWTCVLAGPLGAQDRAWEDFEGPRVEGRIVEAGSGEPMAAAAVRVVTADGERVVGSAHTDEAGRYRIMIVLGAGEDPGPVVVEAGRLGYRVSIGEPFELDPDGVVTRPDLALAPDPMMLDTIQVERRRHWSYIAPPRERVMQRQLQGEGVFLAGATIDHADERTISQTLANRVEGLEFRGVLQSVMGRRCLVVLVNEWPAGLTAINNLRRDHVGAVEIYREWDEVPEELRHHVLNEPGDQMPELCGLINFWLWDSWNRGIEGQPDG